MAPEKGASTGLFLRFMINLEKTIERIQSMKNYKAIIYDIDGTLLNTADMNLYPLMRILKEELDEDWTYEQVGPFTAQPGRKTLADLGIEDVDTVYARWVRYVNEYETGAVPFDGVPQLLDGVRELGLVQAIASSKHAKQYVIDVVSHGIDKFMATAVLCEDTKKHKPDPEPLNLCLERLGVTADEALYVGDTRPDMTAAHSAGMDFAYASWGSFFPMERHEPEYYLDHPLDLLKALA
jgi:HAD superfamily hydrolase (TIGR01549 family)